MPAITPRSALGSRAARFLLPGEGRRGVDAVGIKDTSKRESTMPQGVRTALTLLSLQVEE